MAENSSLDYEELWNEPIYFSLGEVNKKRLLELGENRFLYWETLAPLILLYGVFVIVALLGNVLVVLSVFQKKMRNSRNLLILSLSLSDILLCLVTMPHMLFELSTIFWPYGDSNLLCKLSDFITHIPMYVGGFTVIAMVTINILQKVETGNVKIWIPFGAIWTLAGILAAPFLIWVELSAVPKVEIPEEFHSTEVLFCQSTSWAHAEWLHHRYVYILPLIQILLPGGLLVIEIISVLRREKSFLVAMVTFTFLLSWLPLNLLSLVVTFGEIFDDFDESQEYTSRALFALCYGISMTSACVNPFLYWKLDDKFKEEFEKMWIVKKIFGSRKITEEGKMTVQYLKQDAFC